MQTGAANLASQNAPEAGSTPMGRVLYSGVVLAPSTSQDLLTQYASAIPPGWQSIAHHMTIQFGGLGAAEPHLGKTLSLRVTAIGRSDKAIAIAVRSSIPSSNKVAHITLAINKNAGGQAKDSNDITDWQPVTPHSVKGVVTAVTLRNAT